MRALSRKRTGADIVIECLISEGVDTVFGYPGGQVLDIYDALERNKSSIRHILTAHEQGAAHAADGYARASGKVGVVIATSGPGAANLVTGIATAYLDSIPMVAICGNVDSDQIGRDSFQELDIADITMPITKHNYIVKDVTKLGSILREAFYIARSGRMGPVLVDIPRDIQAAHCELPIPAIGSSSEQKADIRTFKELSNAVSIISGAERPFIYCGGGAVSAGVGRLVTELSERLDAPIGCSLMGLSAVDHEYSAGLGLTGIHGLPYACEAACEADVIIALGARFTDRAVGAHGEYVSGARIVQLDVDPAEIDKNIRDAAYVIGDLKLTLGMLLDALPRLEHKEWLRKALERKNAYNETLSRHEGFEPYSIIREAAKRTGGWNVATDVGQHQMWVARCYPIKGERSFLTSGGLGTMGFGMGASIGAAIASGRPTLLFTGDGSFGMNLNELATAVSCSIPLIVIIMNNSELGMVKQAQKQLFSRTSQSILRRSTDFAGLAEAFGAHGFLAESFEELCCALDKAKALVSRKKPIPCVIDCRIKSDMTVERFDPSSVMKKSR